MFCSGQYVGEFLWLHHLIHWAMQGLCQVKAINDKHKARTREVQPTNECDNQGSYPMWKCTGNTVVQFNDMAKRISQESTHDIQGSPQLSHPRKWRRFLNFDLARTLCAYGMGIWMFLSMSLFLQKEKCILMTGESSFIWILHVR